MKSSITETKITEGQHKQISRLFQDIAGSIKTEIERMASTNVNTLSGAGAQRVIERGNEIKALVPKTTEMFADTFRNISITNQFANEEVSSNYVYPTGYEILPLALQVKILVELFPGLDTTETLSFIKNELPKLVLPRGAEGWFAIPNWKKLGVTYNEALDVVLAMIGKKRKGFVNYHKGETGPEYLHQTLHSAAAWDKIETEQKGDILIVPLQLGLRHRGRSVRRAREVIMDTPGEFALGAFVVGCVALTHPNRFQRHDELDIDCSGDDYALDSDGRFSESVRFYVNDAGLGFDRRYLDSANDYFGSASGFLLVDPCASDS